ncbi:MAG TPA: NAD(P)H-dependent oxidoreductase [Anaerolineaceae bacterium]|nr:NAD(P)H-dependent oxidoreductase [Anaerolineaceae bacterium]
MKDKLHILAFAGSLRTDSYNRKVLKLAQELLPEDISYEIFDLIEIPMFNVDVEKQGWPESVAAFREAIRNADALFIACPEYNSSITGVLKNALDWASRGEKGKPNPLVKKPVAVVGVGERGGTARSQIVLKQVLNHLNMYVVNKPEVLIALKPNNPFDEKGILQDEFAIKFIRDLLKNLIDFTLQLRK